MKERCVGLWLYLVLALLLVGCNQTVSAPGMEEVATVTGAQTAVSATSSTTVPIIENPDSLSLLDQLYEGGYVLYVRHTKTDRSQSDSDTRLGQCATQRNLDAEGQAQALQIRAAYQALDLPVSRIISTQYCRTLETAVLAFGVPEIVERQALADNFDSYVGKLPEAGTNTIIVGHVGTIEGALGLPDTFEEGDALVFAPEADGAFAFVGRIALSDWAYWQSVRGG